MGDSLACKAWMRDTRDSGEHVCNLPIGHVGPHREEDGTPHSISWEEGRKLPFNCCEGVSVFVHSYDCAERDPGGSAEILATPEPDYHDDPEGWQKWRDATTAALIALRSGEAGKEKNELYPEDGRTRSDFEAFGG